MFSSGDFSFRVLHFSHYHFELILYVVRGVYSVFLYLHISIQLLQHHLLKIHSIFYRTAFAAIQ